MKGVMYHKGRIIMTNGCSSFKNVGLPPIHPESHLDPFHHHLQPYNSTISPQHQHQNIHLRRADVADVSLGLLAAVLLDKLVLVLVEVALTLGEVFVDQSVRTVLVTHVQLGLLGYLGQWVGVNPVVLVRLLLLLEEGKGLGRPVRVPRLLGLPGTLDPTPLP